MVLLDGLTIERIISPFKDQYGNRYSFAVPDHDKGHLMPYADAVFPAWRSETNNYINVNHQIIKINRGAWSRLEQTIRNEAINLEKTFEVFTGAFDLTEHSDGVEINRFWYKIVINGKSGIVFVARNEKSSDRTELNSICDDICEAKGWLSQGVRKEIICCSLESFYLSGRIHKIPGTEGVTSIMSHSTQINRLTK